MMIPELDIPFEDGMSHPLECKLKKIDSTEALAGYVHGIYFDNQGSPSRLYNLIRTLGHLEKERLLPWIYLFLETGLEHSDIEVRSASVYTLGSVGGEKAMQILRRHDELCPWLAEHIEEILKYG